jgi:16S rRNA (cytidine1402-2'-O)-methyltransferase
MDSFVFSAFLPHAAGKKKKLFESFRHETRTMIFYDSPRRFLSTLHTIKEGFGGGHRIVIARELSKLYEEIIRGTIDEAIHALEDRDIKGEITILLAAAEETGAFAQADIAQRYGELRRDPSLSTRDIIARLAHETGMSKKDVYKWVLDRAGAT